MKDDFFICNHCGSMVIPVKDNGVPIFCCGEKMEKLVACKTEASREKHIPVYKVEGQKVTVTVGSLQHPMTDEHYIEWVCLLSEEGIQLKKLKPTSLPKATFYLTEDDDLKAVYAYCNLHSLWKA